MSALPEAKAARAQALRHCESKDFQRSLAFFDQALQEHPDDSALLHSKARALDALGRFDEALNCVDQILQRDSANLDALYNRAVILTKLSRRVDALASFEQYLAIQPNVVDVLIKRAYLLHQLNRRADALASVERAVSIAPQNLAALNARGMILDDQGRRREALADFQKILSINPDHSDAITNRAILYAREGNFAEALACYDRSLSIDPNQPNAIYNRSVVRLVLGDWSRGFREFESRWEIFPHEAKRLTRLAPRWLGQGDIKGKVILLHHEQGFGDALQFCRYARLVMQRGAKVFLAVPAGLERLMKTLPGSPQIVSEGSPVPPHDYHCPLMSLPFAFATTPTSVPAQIPHLSADRASINAWSVRLGVRRRLRIGLVWSGRRYPPVNHDRDMSFGTVRPLLAMAADFICLHTELSEEEQAAIAHHANLVWLGDQLTDFADTAALILNLDLVITVDTAVAHLAGALGKPVWVMNRYASCWRWLLERHDSPWYPSLRLFRQPSLGDWQGVVDNALQALGILVGSARPAIDVMRSNATVVSQPETGSEALLQGALDQHNQGQLSQAVAAYRRVLAQSPDHPDTLHYLGIALAQQGLYAEALALLSRAMDLQPENALVHNHYGNALAGLGRHEEAVRSYERAIACDGTSSESFYNLGVSQAALDRLAAALESYDRAIDLKTDHAEALNNRGNLFFDGGRIADALASYERAVASRPQFIDALINVAHVQRRLHRVEAALEAAERALSHAPNSADAHNCRGAILADMGRLPEALDCYDRAIGRNPSYAEAIWNKGLLKLSLGEFRDGWPMAESRWKVKSLRLSQRFPNKPQLREHDAVDGKVVLLHAEQGYGDTIQFSRYAVELAARGARVVLSVPTALKSLMTTLPQVHEVVDQGTERAFDLHCPLMSLPGAVGTEITTIPARIPYLKPDQVAKARWAKALDPHSLAPTIGIAWSGRPTHQNDANRSLSLEQLLPITQLKAQWISLQKDVRTIDLPWLVQTPAIQRCGERLRDFADTAALIDTLDLVITVDTAVAHVAGALGKPVWILLPKVADWRWLQDREDSPWYPTARLFRQPERGDWRSVVDRVNDELQTFMYQRSQSAASRLLSPSADRAMSPP